MSLVDLQLSSRLDLLCSRHGSVRPEMQYDCLRCWVRSDYTTVAAGTVVEIVATAGSYVDVLRVFPRAVDSN